MATPYDLSPLGSLEEQAWVALNRLHETETDAGLAPGLRHVSLSTSADGKTTVFSVAFPTTYRVDNYTPVVLMTPWL